MKLFLLLLSSFCFVIQIQSQTITTAAGNGTMYSSGDGGPFSKATFAGPAHMIYDRSGNLYFSERRTGSIRKVDASSGIISTFAGGFYLPLGMAFDPQEKFMYVAENSCVYRVDMATRAVSVFAGKPGQLCSAFYLCGEGGPATESVLDNPHGVAVDSIGNVYIADDGNSRVRRVDIVTRIITTYAGGGGCNCVGLGDGGPANKGTLLFPSDVLFDKHGDLIISDGGLHNIRKVDSKTGIITTIAGGVQGGAWGYSGDGGPAVNARFLSPAGIFLDKNDDLYIADAGNYVVRRIDKAGIITTIAGNGTMGYSGDCGPALKAQMNAPIHAVVTPNGSVLIGDYYNGVFREVINSAPNVITAATNSLCVNGTLQLTNSARGGTWKSSNITIAKVGSDGVVTALADGKVDISYDVVNGCNTNSSTVTITVQTTPAVGKISGGSSVCEASTIHLANAEGSGVWTSSDRSVASADATGQVKGISGGTATIKYTVSNAVCSNADSVKILVNPLLKPQPITGDTSICVNSKTTLSNGNTGGAWSIKNTSIATIDPVSGVVKGTSAGNSVVTYTVANGCGSATTQVGVNINPLPVFSLGNDTAICVNSALSLPSPKHMISYLWEDGSTASSHVASLPGSYSLQITDSNHCSFADAIEVQNKPLPPVDLGNDTALCNNLTLTLHAADAAIKSYQWNDGSTSPSFTVDKAGGYSVMVTGVNGCMNSDTINVNHLNSPVVSLGTNGSVCPGSPVIIDPRLNDATYLWNDGSTKSTYTVTEPGVYSLTATNFCGATKATVEFKRGLCSLLMPDAFTPNNDGVNDVFRVKYNSFIKVFHFTIFNRWGEKVFETTEPAAGWDGKYKNLNQDSGNYLWTITLTDFEGRTENAKGSVVLIR